MKIQNIHLHTTPAHKFFVFMNWRSRGRLMSGLYLLLMLVAFIGCKKDLNLVPEDNISDATFYRTASDYKLAANLLYQGLDQWGTEDTQSDIAFNNPNSVSNGQLLPTETTSWTTMYTNIRYANNIIDKGAESTDPEIRRFVAEARFFRAYYYYKLYRLYGGVPLISRVLQTGDEELFAPRSSMTQTADFILADLNAAKADLPLQSALSTGDVGRITKGAAMGLASRVALFEGSWLKSRGEANSSSYLDAAVASSQEVISSGVYALYTGNGAQSYRYLFLEPGDDSKETMLDRRYARNIFGHDVPYAYDQDGYNPTRKMADLYLDKNGLPITSPGTVFQGYQTFVSEFQDRDPRMTMTMIIPGTLTNRVFNPVTKVANWPDNPQRNFNTGYILYKYMSEDAAANNSGRLGTASLFDFDKHIIRYAEVLLNYAEAVYEKNGSISDLDLDLSINKLRERVGMPKLTNAFVAANRLEMRTEIRRERTVELSLEGFRYDDLRRWKTAETELPQDIKGIKITGTQWATRAPYSNSAYLTRVDAGGFLISETGRKFNPARDYLQPLPLREIAFYANNGKKLDQNPGW